MPCITVCTARLITSLPHVNNAEANKTVFQPVTRMGSSKTVLDPPPRTPPSTTKISGIDLGLDLEKAWPWPWI